VIQPSTKKRIVVGLLADDQEFQRLQGDDARVAGKRHGFDVEVLYAANNAVAQIQQLFKYIKGPAEERPAAIIVETVVGEGLERVARSAAAAGIGWILINRRVSYLEALRREYPNLPVSVVSTDQVEVGRIQARQFRAIIKSGRGSVLYIQGPSDTSAARERLQGAREGLSGSNITLSILDGSWTESSGEHAIQRWLRTKSSGNARPDVIGCQNDGMAIGARRALAAASSPELASLVLTGCDGLRDGGQRLVNMRHLAATVVTPSNTGPAMDLVARMLKTRQAPAAEVMLKPISYPTM